MKSPRITGGRYDIYFLGQGKEAGITSINEIYHKPIKCQVRVFAKARKLSKFDVFRCGDGNI